VHSVFVSDLSSRSPRLAQRAASIADSITQGGGLHSAHPGPPAAQHAIAGAARAAFTSGLDRILWVAAAGALAGAVLSVILIRPSDFHGSPDQMRAGP
jgi:hypothetical protein